MFMSKNLNSDDDHLLKQIRYSVQSNPSHFTWSEAGFSPVHLFSKAALINEASLLALHKRLTE